MNTHKILSSLALTLSCTLFISAETFDKQAALEVEREQLLQELSQLQQLVFSPMLLNAKEQLDYQRFVLDWQTSENPASQANILVALKQTYMELELLTLSIEQTSAAFTKNPISKYTMQQKMLAACMQQNATLPNIPDQRFCDNYLSFMSRHQQAKHDTKVLPELIKQAGALLSYLKTNQTDTSDFFIAKLLIIKQELEFGLELNTISTTKPALLSLLFKHHGIIKTKQFALLEKSHADSAHAYLAIMHYYLTSQNTPLLRPGGYEGQASLAFQAQTVRDQLQEIARSYRISFIMSCIKKQNPIVFTIDQMCTLLNNIQHAIVQPASPLYTGIVNALASHNWLQQPPSQAHDLQSAAWYALAYSSPFLLEKIVKLVQPYISSDLEKQATSTLAQHNHQKALDFVTKNPEIFKQLQDRHPELLDLLAVSFQHMIFESPALIKNV